jgi:uncharacterized membrane protein YdcZ (DUF606 family)
VTGAVIAASNASATHEALEAHNWGLVIAFTVLLVPLLVWRRVFVGKDGPLSTSKTVAAVWTYVVASALLAYVIAWLIGHHQALDATKSVTDYAILFGGPLGAAILAKQIRVSQENQRLADGTAGAVSTQTRGVADIVVDAEGDPDLGDLQYVLFNIVALVFVIGSIVTHPTHGLPNIPDVLLALTSVSAVGYVGKKAVSAVKPGTPTRTNAG